MARASVLPRGSAAGLPVMPPPPPRPSGPRITHNGSGAWRKAGSAPSLTIETPTSRVECSTRETVSAQKRRGTRGVRRRPYGIANRVHRAPGACENAGAGLIEFDYHSQYGPAADSLLCPPSATRRCPQLRPMHVFQHARPAKHGCRRSLSFSERNRLAGVP